MMTVSSIPVLPSVMDLLSSEIWWQHKPCQSDIKAIAD